MRRIILLTLIAIVGTAGTAAADNWRGRGHRERAIARDHRHHDHRNVGVTPRHDHRRDDRRVYRDYRYVDRRPVYVNNGRFVFNGGYTVRYNRPVIRYRYTNYRYRPQVLVENYSNVPGYIWVAGHWHWNGYEWIWESGHYQVDPNYTPSYYDSGYYDSHVHDDSCGHY